MIQALGFAAAVLTSLAFLPQVVKTWRTRSADDLSMVTLAAQTSGVALWIVYGLNIGSAPVIGSNTVTMVLMLVLVWSKLRFAR